VRSRTTSYPSVPPKIRPEKRSNRRLVIHLDTSKHPSSKRASPPQRALEHRRCETSTAKARRQRNRDLRLRGMPLAIETNLPDPNLALAAQNRHDEKTHAMRRISEPRIEPRAMIGECNDAASKRVRLHCRIVAQPEEEASVGHGRRAQGEARGSLRRPSPFRHRRRFYVTRPRARSGSPTSPFASDSCSSGRRRGLPTNCCPTSHREGS